MTINSFHKQNSFISAHYLLSAISIYFVLFTSTSYAIENSFLEEFDKKYTAAQEECNELVKVPYPKSDEALSTQLPSLKNCVAENLYYGIGQKVDYNKARLCALSANDGMNSGILLMLYANGQGVKRNYKLAKKAACEFSGAPAEIVGRLEHLDVMERDKNVGKIDMCDDITSGMMQGVCTSISANLEDQNRNNKLDQITVRWNSQEKVAFHKLQLAAKKYFELMSLNEVDLSGTARAAMSIDEETSQKDSFLKSILDFETGKLPKFTQKNFKDSDRALNKTYLQLKDLPEPPTGATINLQGVKQVQRAWLEYRDAWVAFGKVKYPHVQDYEWKTYFTKKRITLLKDLIKNW